MVTTHGDTSKPRMKHLHGAMYAVESSSNPGVAHKVDVLNLRCGCTAGRYGKRCHHLVWAIQMDAWRRAHQAKAAEPITRRAGMAALLEAFGA